MLRWSINLFPVRGIQLAVHSSFVLLLAYWAYVGFGEAGLSGMAWSVAELLLFFTCVVLHEFGHSFTARRFGVHVRRILLMPIGGMAEFDAIPREPRSELLITLAGPAVNFVLAALLWPFAGTVFSQYVDPIPSSVSDLVQDLLLANLAMGIFNLAPVFPMDGGRILRALLATRLPYLRATFVAATIGKVLAALAALGALYLDRYLLAVLFAFIFFAGEAEYRSVQRRDAAEEHLRALLSRLAVPSDVPKDEPPLLRR